MLLTAERYGDPSMLELEPSDDMDPYEMANLAVADGRLELANQWLTVLAREGEVSAMRELIEDRGETPFRAWVWMRLSRMLRRDLSQDRHEAINEDGTPYDDEVGGPAYVGASTVSNWCHSRPTRTGALAKRLLSCSPQSRRATS